jgi:hypothetical protein
LYSYCNQSHQIKVPFQDTITSPASGFTIPEDRIILFICSCIHQVGVLNSSAVISHCDSIFQSAFMSFSVCIASVVSIALVIQSKSTDVFFIFNITLSSVIEPQVIEAKGI